MGKSIIRDVANDRDPRSDLGAWLGEELRSARLAGGFASQDALARDLGFDRTTINKAETGASPPSDDVAARLAERFPSLAGGKFTELAAVARRAAAGASRHPDWFGKVWLPDEQRATSLRGWEPILVPGLLQTRDYAGAVIQGCEPASPEKVRDSVLNERLERQAVLDGDTPPDLRVLLDETVLHRLIGSPKTMYEQLVHLADMSCRPAVTVQVLPDGLGAHRGLLGAFLIAEPPGTVYLETVVDAQITGDAAVRDYAALIFDRLTRDALPRAASRDLILKVANERWNG